MSMPWKSPIIFCTLPYETVIFVYHHLLSERSVVATPTILSDFMQKENCLKFTLTNKFSFVPQSQFISEKKLFLSKVSRKWLVPQVVGHAVLDISFTSKWMDSYERPLYNLGAKTEFSCGFAYFMARWSKKLKHTKFPRQLIHQ